MPEPGGRRGPILLCYDGSDFARQAIEDSAAILGGGSAVVVTIFESVGSALLRHPPSEKSELGRQFKEISEEVVDELDIGAAEWAQATAAEGAELAVKAGFDAQSVARRAVSATAERDSGTIWRALLEVADEQNSSLIVVGARGLSGFSSALLGSVSSGLLHHGTRSVLVIPPRQRGAEYPSG